jgi:hypothetical protein
VLLGGDYAGFGKASHLEMTRVDASGAVLFKPWSLLPARDTLMTDYHLAKLGDKVVVAWLEGPLSANPTLNMGGIAVVLPSQ